MLRKLTLFNTVNISGVYCDNAKSRDLPRTRDVTISTDDDYEAVIHERHAETDKTKSIKAGGDAETRLFTDNQELNAGIGGFIIGGGVALLAGHLIGEQQKAERKKKICAQRYAAMGYHGHRVVKRDGNPDEEVKPRFLLGGGDDDEYVHCPPPPGYHPPAYRPPTTPLGYRPSSAYDRPTYSPPKVPYQSGSSYHRPSSYKPPVYHDRPDYHRPDYHKPDYHRPSSSYDRPSSGYKPSSSYDRPSSSYSRPSSSYDRPSSSYHKPSSSYDRPSSSYDRPSTSYHKPSSTYDRPSSSYSPSYSSRPSYSSSASSSYRPDRYDDRDRVPYRDDYRENRQVQNEVFRC